MAPGLGHGAPRSLITASHIEVQIPCKLLSSHCIDNITIFGALSLDTESPTCLMSLMLLAILGILPSNLSQTAPEAFHLASASYSQVNNSAYSASYLSLASCPLVSPRLHFGEPR